MPWPVHLGRCVCVRVLTPGAALSVGAATYAPRPNTPHCRYSPSVAPKQLRSTRCLRARRCPSSPEVILGDSLYRMNSASYQHGSTLQALRTTADFGRADCACVRAFSTAHPSPPHTCQCRLIFTSSSAVTRPDEIRYTITHVCCF